MTERTKLRLATVWLDGCSGCHMSFLDMDEWLLELAERADLVYSPLVDTKEFPPTWTSPWSRAPSAARTTSVASSRSASAPPSWCPWATAP